MGKIYCGIPSKSIPLTKGEMLATLISKAEREAFWFVFDATDVFVTSAFIFWPQSFAGLQSNVRGVDKGISALTIMSSADGWEKLTLHPPLVVHCFEQKARVQHPWDFTCPSELPRFRGRQCRTLWWNAITELGGSQTDSFWPYCKIVCCAGSYQGDGGVDTFFVRWWLREAETTPVRLSFILYVKKQPGGHGVPGSLPYQGCFVSL